MRTAGPTSIWYGMKDERGNVVQWLHASDDFKQRVQYDAWGVPTLEPGDWVSGLQLTWKGLWWEPPSQVGGQGLYYMRARWYDPELGRFLSEDPIGVAGGLNPYVYGRNDPINATDPSGKLWVYIWNSDLLNGVGGHASIQLDNGTYISWWPEVDNYLKAISWLDPSFINLDGLSGNVPGVARATLKDDEDKYGRPADYQRYINFLDEKAIGKWWTNFRTTASYNLLSQNCSQTIVDALNAGGANISGGLYPSKLIPQVKQLNPSPPVILPPLAPRDATCVAR